MRAKETSPRIEGNGPCSKVSPTALLLFSYGMTLNVGSRKETERQNKVSLDRASHAFHQIEERSATSFSSCMELGQAGIRREYGGSESRTDLRPTEHDQGLPMTSSLNSRKPPLQAYRPVEFQRMFLVGSKDF